MNASLSPRFAPHRFAAGTAAAAVLSLALLSGCSLLDLGQKKAPPPPPPEPPKPVAHVPEATHRFTFDPAHDDVVGRVQTTVITSKDDTLPDLARRFNVGYEEIVRANPGVDPWLPGEGRQVYLPTQFILPDAPREGVVINVAAMRLYYFPKHEKGKPATVITHPIGIGKVGWQTPEGVTKVISRTKDPVWTPPASVRKEHLENDDPLPARVPAGPDNPLGAHMFRLGWPSYLIHGTNKPYGVGMRSSHGCIRLYPEDIAILFDTIPIGTQLRVVNQPYVVGWKNDSLYVQAYGPLEDDKRDWQHGPKSLLKKAGKSPTWQRIKARDAEIDWEAARAVSVTPRGIPVPVMKATPSSVDAVLASAWPVDNILPKGATWSGKNELLVDEQQFDQMLSDREPATPTPSAAPVPARKKPTALPVAGSRATTPQ